MVLDVRGPLYVFGAVLDQQLSSFRAVEGARFIMFIRTRHVVEGGLSLRSISRVHLSVVSRLFGVFIGVNLYEGRGISSPSQLTSFERVLTGVRGIFI